MPDLFQMPRLMARRLYRKLWLRVTLYAVLALFVAVAATVLDDYIPARLSQQIGPDAVMPVLTILASSMLAVSTFSLNIMVSAHRAAAVNATPRIHRLLREDTTTQSVLATFIGAFVYALTTIILFRANLYAESAAVLIMGVTIVVVVLVIVNMLRWIEHLSHMGSLDDSLRQTYDRARDNLIALVRDPAHGASPLTEATVVPATGLSDVPAPGSGYVQLVDVKGLSACLPESSSIYILRGPGRHVLRGEPVAQISGTIPPERLDRVARCFVLGDMRTYEQDPEFALIALSEISSKALSPGVNDPGTAIEAITRLETLLWDYAQADRPPCAPHSPRVFLPVPSAARLIEAAFAATARDGAGTIEVALQLRQALLALARARDVDLSQAARDMAGLALDHADRALPLDAEKARLRATHA